MSYTYELHLNYETGQELNKVKHAIDSCDGLFFAQRFVSFLDHILGPDVIAYEYPRFTTKIPIDYSKAEKNARNKFELVLSDQLHGNFWFVELDSETTQRKAAIESIRRINESITALNDRNVPDVLRALLDAKIELMEIRDSENGSH